MTAIPNEIHGIFTYLNLVVDPDTLRRLNDVTPSELGRGMKEFHSPLSTIEERIRRDFNVASKRSGIRKALECFRIYYEADIVNALSWAYCLYRRGEAPTEAFLADYSVSGFGMLEWATQDADTRRDFISHFRPGDRYVSFLTVGSGGLMLVRGDRLVAYVTEVHLTDPRPSEEFLAKLERFKELGGSRAFLNGEFEFTFQGDE